MSPAARLRLMKLLALASSPQDGEALAALRLAGLLLEREGQSFAHLALGALGTHSLPNIAEEVEAKLGAQELELLQWRERAKQLKDQLEKARADAEFWRSQAKESAERLWDIGTQMGRKQLATTGDRLQTIMQEIADTRTENSTPLPPLTALR